MVFDRLARAVLAASLAAGASMIGCGRASSATIVVTVAIEDGDGLHIPTNINRLNLTLSGASADAGTKRTLSYVLLGSGQPEQRGVSVIPVPAGPEGLLTVKLGIEVGAGASGPLTIEAVALLDDVPIVSQSLKKDFDYFKTAPPVLELKRSCVLRECPAGQTCQPGFGCKLLGDTADGGTPSDAGDIADLGKPNGPPCDCDGFFPFCVGATWKYHVCGGNSRTDCDLIPKTWVIADATSIMREGKPAPSFALTRFTAGGNTRKQLTFVDGRLLWLSDESFDSSTWKPTQARYYLPEKLRFDENRGSGSEPWSLTFDEIVLDGPDDAQPEVRRHEDTWSVISLDDDPVLREDIVKYGFPKVALAGLEILCHHRIDKVVPESASSSREATYCFARHIGKIFELTTGGVAEEEWLLWSELPKGSSCISVPETLP